MSKPKRTKKPAKAKATPAKAKPKGKAAPAKGKGKAKAKAPAAPAKKAKAAAVPAKKAKATAVPAKAAPAKAKPAGFDASVTIREPIQPLDRGDRYEDPVFAALKRARLGGAGDGAGSLCSKDGEIEEVDFDLRLSSVDAVPLVVKVLEENGAPKGSLLRYEHGGKDIEVRFGVSEGVAIYLDGISQAPEVYASTSAEELLDQVLAALGDQGEFRGSWHGPRETSLYLYGHDAEEMFTTIEPVLRAYPLSRNARVVLRLGFSPREVRLAMISASA